jgi:hypothetical protein
MAKVPVSARVEQRVIDRLDEMAAHEKTTRSEIAGRVLSRVLADDRCETCHGTGEVRETGYDDSIDMPNVYHNHEFFVRSCPVCVDANADIPFS